MSTETRTVGGRTVELSSPDKLMDPDAGITKRDVVDYYERVAGTMLPHVRGRVISMHRWPDGIGGKDFYQKQAPDYFPDWICLGTVEKTGGQNRQVVVDEPATLVYLAAQASLTPHVWSSRSRALRCPDLLVFDFDPPGGGEGSFEEVRWAARRMRALLADLGSDLGLDARVMTSGSRGLHVHASLAPIADFEVVKPLARGIAEVLAVRHPERLTTEVRKNKRKGRIFIDYLRNEYAQTSVAPYALRALSGAPVATPLAWDELGASGMGPRRYTLKNLFRRLGRMEDPWAEAVAAGPSRDAPSAPELTRRLDTLAGEPASGNA